MRERETNRHEQTTGGHTRRTVLRGGAAAVLGLPVLAGHTGATTSPQTISISTNADKVTRYAFTTSGSVSPHGTFDTEDTIDGGAASGTIGPKSGSDAYAFTGEITGFACAGPARIELNGSEVTESELPPLANQGITTDDLHAVMDPNDPQHTIQFTNPTELTVYEFGVEHRIWPTDDSKHDLPVPAEVVSSHVGPTSGTDTYHFEGYFEWFTMFGECDVIVDGTLVSPGTASPETATPPEDCGCELVLANTAEHAALYRARVSGDVWLTDAEGGDEMTVQPDGTTVVTGTLPSQGDEDLIWFTGRLLGLTAPPQIRAVLKGEPIIPGDYPPVEVGE